MAFLGLVGRKRHERTGFMLYGAVVSAARDPFHYTHLGVPDTLDGRFDLVGLYACLLIRRLRGLPPPGPDLAQAAFDAMFSDMDVSLREMGVGDLSVGRRVRAMWEAFHGRAKTYETACDSDDPGLLLDALRRNVWRGAEPPPGAAEGLARLTRAQVALLELQPLPDLAAGKVAFLSAAQAAG